MTYDSPAEGARLFAPLLVRTSWWKSRAAVWFVVVGNGSKRARRKSPRRDPHYCAALLGLRTRTRVCLTAADSSRRRARFCSGSGPPAWGTTAGPAEGRGTGLRRPRSGVRAWLRAATRGPRRNALQPPSTSGRRAAICPPSAVPDGCRALL